MTVDPEPKKRGPKPGVPTGPHPGSVADRLLRMPIGDQQVFEAEAKTIVATAARVGVTVTTHLVFLVNASDLQTTRAVIVVRKA